LSGPRRVINEIRYKILRKPSDYAALVFYIIASGLMYLLYLPELNKPTPTFGGLSVAYAYSLIIWVIIMISIFYAIATSWK
jgi:hypothetical protein